MQLLGNVGWLFRIIIAFGFAAFWGYLAWYWNDMGDYGPGKPTVYGVAGLAFLAGMSGLIGLVRMVTSTAKIDLPERTKARAEVDAQSDLDADAIIARYMERREAEGLSDPRIAPDSRPAEPPAMPQRPQFGRKQS